MTHSINWFEIPVTDFARAKKFYETLYGADIMEMRDLEKQDGDVDTTNRPKQIKDTQKAKDRRNKSLVSLFNVQIWGFLVGIVLLALSRGGFPFLSAWHNLPR